MTDTPDDNAASALDAERSILSIYLKHRAAAQLRGEPWTIHGYHQAIDNSALKKSVKNTLHAMVDQAGTHHSTVDRATLCLIIGVRREATITAHWNQAREAGLLVSRQRWNSTSVHMFRIPGTGLPADEVQWGEPLGGWHVWLGDETTWWDSLDPGQMTNPPWHGDERPPF